MTMYLLCNNDSAILLFSDKEKAEAEAERRQGSAFVQTSSYPTQYWHVRAVEVAA